MLEFDRGELEVLAVRVGGSVHAFTVDPGHLLVPPPPHLREGSQLRVAVEYRGAPRFGVEFVPDRFQVYTVFSTSQWLVSDDRPNAKAPIDVTLVLPPRLTVVANGRLVSRSTRADGKQVLMWRERRPLPSYTYGFAAGRFVDVTADQGRLRYLGEGFSPDELRRIFRESAAMRAFFEHVAGIRYDAAIYTQALVAETVGQELGEFALLSNDYGRSVLADGKGIGLMAHEWSHQWWGNRVTCRDWTQFWLNEGFATFMAAAYLEQRFGTAAYRDAIERSRLRYAAVVANGADHALVYDSWNQPSAADRTIVYHKGAYVLYQLRLELGDAAFWKAIRDYTREYFDKNVTTAEFQSAVEKSSRRDLSQFFRRWVYGAGARADTRAPHAPSQPAQVFTAS